MSTVSWLRSLRRRWFVHRPVGRTPIRRVRPTLEVLEDRTVPTVFATVGAGDTATLIADIKAANSNGASSNTINLSAGNYDLTAIDNYWYGPDGLPAISSNLIINGNGATIERDSSAPDFRLFYVSGGLSDLPMGNLTLNNLTLQGGVAKGGDSQGGGGGLGAGGAIFNQGAVALDGVTVTGNTAQGGNSSSGNGGGGGIGQDAQGTTGGGFGSGFPTGVYGGKGGSGGAVYVAAGGGGFSADGQNDSNGVGSGGGQSGLGGSGGGVPGGAGGDGGGGADVYGYGGAGGDFGFGGTGQGAGGAGGGGGGVGGGGGGGFNGGGGSGGGGGFGGGGGEFVSGASGGTAGGGLAGFAGGVGSTTSFGDGGGDGGFGGGGGGGEGGAGGGGAALGGAVFNMYGSLAVTNSTLTGNTAQGGNGYGAGSGLGGAVFNLDGTVNLTFSTIAANTVAAGTANGGPPGSADGGALYNLAYGHTPDGKAVTASSTLVDNILSNTQGGTHDLVNDQDTRTGYNDGTATVDASAPNIVMAQAVLNGTTITGKPLTSDPQLGKLQDNGGPTQTMAVTTASPAYQAGTPVNGVTTDQRGLPRSTTKPTLGAFEVQKASTTTTANSTTAVFSESTQSVTLTASVTSSATVNEGTMTFTLLQGNSVIGKATTSPQVSNGQASVSYGLPAGTPAGTYTIDAVYNPGSDFATSSDGNQTVTITAANGRSNPSGNAPSGNSSPGSTPASPAQVQQAGTDALQMAAGLFSGDFFLFQSALAQFRSLPPSAQQAVIQTLGNDINQLLLSGLAASNPQVVDVLFIEYGLLTNNLLDVFAGLAELSS